MTIALWVLQVLTALVFGGHGLVLMREQTAQRVPWAAALPDPFVRVLGVLEILGAIGVVLPALTDVLPSLTVAAAGGLVAMMLLAILFHITRREWPNIGLNIVLGALAFAVAYGRLVIEPF